MTRKLSDSVEIDKRIDQYPDAQTPLYGDELLEIFQDGSSKKISIENLPSGTGGGTVSSGMREAIVQFNVPSTTWVYNHNFGKIPIIRVYDHGVIPTEYFAEITHSIDKNTSTITMQGEMSGFIIANY